MSKPRIVLINYDAGNVQSVLFALQRLGYEALLTNDSETISRADKVIFPGVGEAGSAMQKLTQSGLDKLIPKLTQPVLGICLGMQLLCSHSEEGDTQGLKVFDAKVERFNNDLKVPQMGWNTIENLKGPLFKNIPEKSYMYLVHSYYVPLHEATAAESEYGNRFSVALQKDNFYGVQFHPEKSADMGSRLLKNFIEI